MVRPATKAERLEMGRARVARLLRLRKMGAPQWVVRMEQVSLVLNRAGMKVSGLGKPMSARQSALVEKFVRPHLG